MKRKLTLAELTSRLIEFKTIDGNRREFERCLHFIANYFKGVPGLYYNQYQDHDYHSLVITNRDTRHPEVMLSGHIDVIDAEDEQFSPSVKDNRLYGRGALDMKSGVAAIMDVLKRAQLAGNAPSLGLMITTDEELGGLHGARYLVDEKGWRANFALMAEGQLTPVFVTRQKGIAWVKVTARGRSTHGAYPWLGDNAALKLMAGYRAMAELFPEPRDDWISTISLSSIKTAATAHNQVPNFAEAVLDVRYTSDLAGSPDEILTLLQAKAPDVELEIFVGSHVLDTDGGNGHVSALRDAAARVTGRTLPFGFTHGASDAMHFARYGVATVEFGPQGANHHGENEYVELKSLAQYHQIIDSWITALPV